jgi:hypothetical protein
MDNNSSDYAPSDAGGGSAWQDGLLSIGNSLAQIGLNAAKDSLARNKQEAPVVSGQDVANANARTSGAKNWAPYAIGGAVIVVVLVLFARK